ncbi:DUF1064 domain-containing protein [Bergeriella denitrificans]|uniref:Protein of uncharacterized function (DUF1064) n=1 Tax=Bergeriella denitrificans TaxID=494 RepID=A0A378UJ43_BERDE|nr:DUF1064 domain-containing protein [Bergeriella denitrificans]STZ77366.1 Protein of uncharacterised function (DUF1064) [Bergeriella denitrificans]
MATVGSKYGNRKTNGYDSRREAQYAAKLEALRRAADPETRVADIRKQVPFELIPAQRGADGKVVERACKYIADFVVTRASGRVDVIDVKGFKTPDYIIKRKLMLKVHGIRILEV